MLYHDLLFSEKPYTYLADLNEQAEGRLDYIIQQMKAQDQMLWLRSMNGIRNRAEEIIKNLN